MSCCEVTEATAGCAICETYGDETCGESKYTMPDVMGGGSPSTERCTLFSALLALSTNTTARTTYDANLDYDPSYDELPSCAAFDFYPISEARAMALTLESGIPTDIGAPATLDLSDCSDRYARYSAASVASVASFVHTGVEEIICDFESTGSSTCASTLTDDDFDWRFSEAIASEDQLIETGLSRRCTMWDGGPDGLDLFPYIDIRNILGDRYDTGASAIEVLYFSRGSKSIGQNLRAVGEDISDNEADDGRKLWLAKFTRASDGRHNGGNIRFAGLSSNSFASTFEKQAVPELPILMLGYALVLTYAIIVGGSANPSLSATDPANEPRVPQAQGHRLDRCTIESGGRLLHRRSLRLSRPRRGLGPQCFSEHQAQHEHHPGPPLPDRRPGRQ